MKLWIKVGDFSNETRPWICVICLSLTIKGNFKAKLRECHETNLDRGTVVLIEQQIRTDDVEAVAVGADAAALKDIAANLLE
jgi:hypothetical protein